MINSFLEHISFDIVLDLRGLANLNAALEVKFSIRVEHRWVNFQRSTQTLTVPDLLTFQMSQANIFKPSTQPPLPPPVRHRDIHRIDTERGLSLNLVGQLLRHEQRKYYFLRARQTVKKYQP